MLYWKPADDDFPLLLIAHLNERLSSNYVTSVAPSGEDVYFPNTTKPHETQKLETRDQAVPNVSLVSHITGRANA